MLAITMARSDIAIVCSPHIHGLARLPRADRREASQRVALATRVQAAARSSRRQNDCRCKAIGKRFSASDRLDRRTATTGAGLSAVPVATPSRPRSARPASPRRLVHRHSGLSRCNGAHLRRNAASRSPLRPTHRNLRPSTRPLLTSPSEPRSLRSLGSSPICLRSRQGSGFGLLRKWVGFASLSRVTRNAIDKKINGNGE